MVFSICKFLESPILLLIIFFEILFMFLGVKKEIRLKKNEIKIKKKIKLRLKKN